MRLLFRQRFFSWLDSYDIYDESGNAVYEVKGQIAWGHCLKIFDVSGNELGTVQERAFTFLPKFEMYIGDKYVGCISREFSFLHPHYNIDCNGWQVEGDLFEWDYSILDASGGLIATASKQLQWTDTYTIDIVNPADALCVLMFMLAMDAEKCSRD